MADRKKGLGRKNGPGKQYKAGAEWTGWRGGPVSPNPDLKEAWRELSQKRSASRARFAAVYERVQDFTYPQLVEFCNREDVPALELMAARCFLRVIERPFPEDFMRIVEACCGPEPKQIELSAAAGGGFAIFQSRPTKELLDTYLEVRRQLEEKKWNSTGTPPLLSESSLPSEVTSRDKE